MDDSISRQAAIEIVDRYNKSHMILKGKPMLGAASIVIELEALPSAQPEKRTKERTETHACDLIDRQAAIRAVNTALFPKINTAKDAEKALRELPSAQPEPQWIPCSKRLPEQYGNYLVSYRTDDFESDIGTFDPDRINSDTGEWSACDANGFYWVASKGLEVIAWMPLPEPYKERREE